MASLHDAAFFCIPETDLPEEGSTNYRLMYCVVSLVSSTLGLVGSGYQVIAWWRHKKDWSQRRTGRVATNPVIIFYLALSNFMSCIGVILRTVAMLLTSSPDFSHKETPTAHFELEQSASPTEAPPECEHNVMPNMGTPIFIWGSLIETFTQFSFCCAIIWTFLYAIDTQAQLHYGQHIPSKIYHCTSWPIAMATASIGQLVVTIDLVPSYKCAEGTRLLVRYLSAYIPVFTVIILNPIFLWSNFRLVKKTMLGHTATFTDTERQVLTKLRQKFISIVFLFTLCWLPNLVDSIFQFASKFDCMYPMTPEPQNVKLPMLFPIWVIEAVFNPLQGLFNCFVFGRGWSYAETVGRDKHRNRINANDSYSAITPERDTLL